MGVITKFNPTGTHVHKGFLKVRIDLYPSVGDKTYEIHHIQVPVIPPEGYQGKVDKRGRPTNKNDYSNWIDGLPKVWQLNPFLCAFIRVSETVVKGELEDFTHQVFNKDILASLDDILIRPDSAHLVSALMRGKLILSDQRVQTKDITDLIGSVNGRFADLVLPLGGNGEIIDLEPQSIDIGAPAIWRLGDAGITWTLVEQSNPANADGSIDTVEIFLQASATNCEVATFFVVSGNNLSTRDYEFLGDVSSGSTQPFPGLTMDVETDDYLGIHASSGNIKWASSGGIGRWWKSADYIPCTNEAFSSSANQIISLYGTGEEVGGPTLQSVGGGSIAIAGVLGRNIFIGVGEGSVTIAGALTPILTFLQTVGEGAVSIVGSLGRLTKIAIGDGSIAISGALGLLTKLAVGAGAITITGTLGRKIALTVGSGSVAIAGALVANLITLIHQAVGDGAVAIQGGLSIVHIVFVSVARGSIAIAGALGRSIFLSVGSGSIAIAGGLSIVHITLVSVARGSVAIAGTLGLKTLISVGEGSIAIASTLGRLIKIGVGAGAITITGTINRLIKIRVGMPSLYEYYITNDDGFLSLYDTAWLFQGFTPVVFHRISSVKLKLYRAGLPGIATISIRATSGETPTGSDLCSGTIDGDTLTTDTAGTWYEISLGAGCNLDATTKYAIVIRAPSGSTFNRVYWRVDGTSPTYAGGKAGSSSNSGGWWDEAFPSNDLMFEEWGGAVAISGTLGRLIKINVGDGAVAIAGILIRISEWIALTLKGRAFGLTLPSRTINLTLRHRNLSLTLESRTLTLSLGGRSLSLTLPKRK